MKKLIYIIILLIICISIPQSVYGIPAFARKYSMSCKTCHSPAPALKAYGEEFAANGFVLADQDAPRYFVPTGDDDLSLLRELPLALRMEGYLTYNNSASKTNDISAPYILKILSGGALAKDVAYYFYFFFSERGEVAGIEDAFIMFNNVIGSGVDVFMGQYQVSDPLFKRELRLTFEDYQIYRVSPGASQINLTYDRGIMLTYGLPTKTDITVELLNGSGIGQANSNKIFDKDKYKNILGRLSQEITGFLRAGVFGYYGKEEISAAGSNGINKILMYGPDLTLTAGPLEINAQYVERKDDDNFESPASAVMVNNAKTRGAFTEAIYRPRGDDSKWYLAGLFNWVESDLDRPSNSLNYKSGTFHAGYLLKRNIRLVSEYTYNFTGKFGRLGVGFISAF